jgi:N-acetylmuramoyl-L-alanine amidase
MPRRLQLGLLLLAAVAIFAMMIGTDRTFGTPGVGRGYVLHIALPPAGGVIGLPKVAGPPDASRPLVVLDPGHGGHDPGAGTGELKEKTLTLQLARALRDELLKEGGIRVAMTRDEDRYLMLAERSSIARRLRADLFLSIHADSAESDDAHGASVYTLSERGSSQAAARIAARENQADRINGVVLADTSDTVSAILVDLSQRETQASSNAFARLIVRELRGRLRLRGNAVQSAAFAVLKSPDLPSALFEAGYISNPEDQALLASAEGQRAFAEAAARAIRVYFARRSGASPSR